jgi:hypothetical protein
MTTPLQTEKRHLPPRRKNGEFKRRSHAAAFAEDEGSYDEEGDVNGLESGRRRHHSRREARRRHRRRYRSHAPKPEGAMETAAEAGLSTEPKHGHHGGHHGGHAHAEYEGQTTESAADAGLETARRRRGGGRRRGRHHGHGRRGKSEFPGETMESASAALGDGIATAGKHTPHRGGSHRHTRYLGPKAEVYYHHGQRRHPHVYEHHRRSHVLMNSPSSRSIAVRSPAPSTTSAGLTTEHNRRAREKVSMPEESYSYYSEYSAYSACSDPECEECEYSEEMEEAAIVVKKTEAMTKLVCIVCKDVGEWRVCKRCWKTVCFQCFPGHLAACQ